MVPLRLPGGNTEGVLFKDPEIRYSILIFQYSLLWEKELLGALELDHDQAVTCHGFEANRSKFLYIELDFDEAAEVVSRCGRYPHFVLPPLLWYTREDVHMAPHRLGREGRRSEPALPSRSRSGVSRGGRPCGHGTCTPRLWPCCASRGGKEDTRQLARPGYGLPVLAGAGGKIPGS